MLRLQKLGANVIAEIFAAIGRGLAKIHYEARTMRFVPLNFKHLKLVSYRAAKRNKER